MTDARLAHLHGQVRKLSRAEQELFVERWAMRTEDGSDDLTAGWAALDEVRARTHTERRGR